LGLLEKVVIPNFFDVIQTKTTLTHSFNPALSIENMLNSLRHKGVLFFPTDELIAFDLIPSKAFEEHSSAVGSAREVLEGTHPPLLVWRMLKTLESQGFKVPSLLPYKTGSIQSLALRSITELRKARKDARADLSEFYSHPKLNPIPITPA